MNNPQQATSATSQFNGHVFTGHGIELEYMIVGRDNLNVMPIADRILPPSGELEHGILGWSNEIALHVIELKNPRPLSSLVPLSEAFQHAVQTINNLLEPRGACLMPTAMHPWMNPRNETRLWPHNNQTVYRAYDRIFDSHRHGWSNLQSMHINLPFCGDAEFARLHAAIRLILPVLPALAASSPIADQRRTGYADYRMHVYAHNAEKVPSITGKVIPENVSSRVEYEAKILAPMYRDVAPFDPDRILQHEWLNSHGAIARFDRSAIEIRMVDTQECPAADLAIATATDFAVQSLYRHPDSIPLATLQSVTTDRLVKILNNCVQHAEQAIIDDPSYLALLGYRGDRCSAQELWKHLLAPLLDDVDDDNATPGQPSSPRYSNAWKMPLRVILEHGPLARRILRATGTDESRSHLEFVYGKLCGCLQNGRMFMGLQN